MATDSFGTGTPGEDAFPAIDTLSYEQARDELIETVKILELGQMSLDESLKYWERGEALAKACENHLDGASKRVEDALNARAAGSESADSAVDNAVEDSTNTDF
ncbi:exodeoxyribonuclease VII [Corynebacterium stationis]|uniref:exodeoxyribonuclease VII small subunit n=1 Tax=Corynebacterium stationis TaxID=1705 RepID=UPI0009505C3A|nr:exodeoxyribonuclease VII small subunit [Corynebacterium stationis]APT95402.1 exodeoxyribonuclease VII [Corynebacterium stationis]